MARDTRRPGSRRPRTGGRRPAPETCLVTVAVAAAVVGVALILAGCSGQGWRTSATLAALGGLFVVGRLLTPRRTS